MEEDFSDLRIGDSAESLRRSLDSQRDFFHAQVDQLQRIVVTQCQLTGVNPLAQEMAAGALSIKIGKRPRDLLNSKAVKYMQSIFSIKDAVSKKECREISALFGVTVTQVREFFASQRSRVRKLVNLSREKAIRSNAYLELQEEIPTSSDSLVPLNLVPLNTIVPTKADETPSCSTEDDALPGIDDSDKQFVENIFSLMRKEETFSGQVKLMEWILQIQNSAVLFWFLSKGGMVILATWLTEAGAEEQTSVLLVILNVLCHLPLNKALPVHLSAILQSVNRLRFYKTSDISNRARVLLSKWSKSFARSQALKKLNGVNSSIDAQRDLMLKQSLSDVIADESWQSNFDTPENILGCSEDFWKSEPTLILRLPPPSDDSNKKNILGVSSSQIRERRKVQLVEHPGQKTAGRSPQAARAAQSNQSRPMSTDDIQKAKMRAQFMQNKYKKASVSNENKKLKTEVHDKPSTSLVGTLPPLQPKDEQHKKPMPLSLIVPNTLEDTLDLNPRPDLKESFREKSKRVWISWQTPSEVKLNHSWRVGAGENSKEVEVQKNRNRREKETVYQMIQEIPPNSKEPWDLEIDYDDTLTPVIPAEQLPEGDNMETHSYPVVCDEVPRAPHNERENGVVTASRSHVGNASTAEPDLDLLAVLLKNPELVMALTSGQAANLSSADTVKLLDMIKAGGAAGNASSFNGVDDKQVEEKAEVSLPSPTPPSNPGTSGWRPQVARNPFSQVNRAASNQSAAVGATLVPKQTSEMHFALPQIPAVVPSSFPQYSQPHVTSVVHEKYGQLGGPLHHNLSLIGSSSVQTNLYSLGNTKSAHVSSTTNSFINSVERFHISTASQSPSPSQLLAHQQRPAEHYQPRPIYSKEVGELSSEFWRARQGLLPNYNNLLLNQSNSYSNNAASFGGSDQPGPPPWMQTGQQWEGNEYAEGEDFESWSPDNSPTMNRDYAVTGRNFPEPRMGYRPDQSRVRNSSNQSSGHREYSRYGDRKWNGRRR